MISTNSLCEMTEPTSTGKESQLSAVLRQPTNLSFLSEWLHDRYADDPDSRPRRPRRDQDDFDGRHSPEPNRYVLILTTLVDLFTHTPI